MPQQTLKPRDRYLRQLISLQDKDPIKVITGVRRCGKSSLLKLMQAHLLESGVSPEQIIAVDCEAFASPCKTVPDLYQFVNSRMQEGRRMYLFLDEIQQLHGWENAVNAFRVEFPCDIYLAGSNACLFSSAYATYLSGRYVELHMYPLSFREFLDFHSFQVKTGPDAFGTQCRQITGPDGNPCPLSDAFSAYLCLGGMPGIADVGLDPDRAMMLLDGICSTILLRDVLDLAFIPGRQQLSDAALLLRIACFLADRIGTPQSIRSISRALSQGGLRSYRMGNSVSPHTVQAYAEALQECYLFSPCKRYDVKSKTCLQTQGKYYIADLGLRNALLGLQHPPAAKPVLENVVYFELLRRGYSVAVGKVGDKEIDFIASNAETKKYYQVTETMLSEDVRKWELAPLQSVPDNYDKTVLSLTPGLDSEYNGIRSLSLIDWLLDENL